MQLKPAVVGSSSGNLPHFDNEMCMVFKNLAFELAMLFVSVTIISLFYFNIDKLHQDM